MSKNTGAKINERKNLHLVTCTLLLAAASLARAQQPTKIPRIGYPSVNFASSELAHTDAFWQGLRGLGYAEGKNIVIEFRFAEGKVDRLPALAAELVRLKVGVIVTAGTGSTRSANEATNTIPIVMTQDPDPVGNGFVVSLGRPGGNITGLLTLSPELSEKRLELMKEIIPKLASVAVLGTATNSSNTQSLRETEIAAGALAVKLQYLDVRGPKKIETAFQAASKDRADAVLLLGGPVLASQRTQFADLAVRRRLPAAYWRSDIVEAGGLMSYAVSLAALDRRAAIYVDKILKGAKPGDLPVEQPMKFDFVVNLRAAKQIA